MKHLKLKPTPLSLQRFIDFGGRGPCERSGAAFLWAELPRRLTFLLRLTEEMEPQELVKTAPAKQIRSFYMASLNEVTSFSPDITEENAPQFTEVVARMYERHTPVVELMSEAIQDLKIQNPKFARSFPPALHRNLDDFFTRRLGVRVLAQQHLHLSQNDASRNKAFVGIIDPRCDAYAVVNAAASDAKELCDLKLAESPNFEIDLPTGVVHFPYIPAHLYHMVFELMKNSFRAVVEFQPKRKDGRELPPVKIAVVEGDEDLTIKISDLGGGIARSGLRHIFSYMYTTAERPVELGNAFAGLGFGLPLSRVYARYFGGDLKVISVEGFGTDAYIYLKRVGSQAGEVLEKKVFD